MRAWLCILLLLGCSVVYGETPVSVRVSTHFTNSPGYMVSTIRVSPNADNRQLTMMVDGESYYTSSYEELDGDKAPTIRTYHVDHLPEGHYIVSAVVVQVSGKQFVAHDTFCVNGMNIDCNAE